MGVLLAFFSTLLGTGKDLVSKRISFLVDGTTSTFASFFFALPFYALLLAVCYFFDFEVTILSIHFFNLVLLRSLSDAGAEWTKMQALAGGEISLIAPFISLAPLFLLLLSPLITGDPLTVYGVLAVVISVIGTLLVAARPSVRHDKAALRSIGMALLTSFFFAINTCFDRLAVQVSTPVFSGFAMTLLAALFFMPLVIFKPHRMSSLRVAAPLLFLRGAIETIFMVTKLWALVYLSAPSVAAISRLSLIFSIVGGKVFFDDKDFGRRMAGGVLIVVAALLVVFFE